MRMHRLFAAHRVGRERTEQGLHDRALGGEVDLGHEITGLLGPHLDRAWVGGRRADHPGRGPCGHNGNVEQGGG